jgi:amino acid transporter
MNKILAISILGMGLTGAVLIISIALLFNSPIGNVLKMVTAASTLSFIIFAVSALVFRRRLDDEERE